MHADRKTKGNAVGRVAVLAVAAFALGGCTTTPRTEAAIEMKDVRAVQAEIKRQVAVYMAMQNDAKSTSQDADIAAADAKARANADSRTSGTQCGRGDINFRLTKITTTLVTKQSGNVGVSGDLPIPTASFVRNNDQTLVFNELVVPDFYQDDKIFRTPSKEERESAALAVVLFNLRNGLIEASLPGKEPTACLTSYAANPADMAGSFEIGILVKREGNLKVQIIIGGLKYGPSLGGSITDTSTLKATFEPYYMHEVPKALAKAVSCTDPKQLAATISCRADNGKLAWCNGCNGLISKEDVVSHTQGGRDNAVVMGSAGQSK